MPSIPHLPTEAYVAIGVAAALFLLWLWVHFSRRHFVVIRKSDTTDMIAIQLGRIADALDRLASLATPRDLEAPGDAKPVPRTNWMSMFPR